MKRFLISLVAVAGLVASLMALATSASNPTSGQVPSPASIVLKNVSGFQTTAGARAATAVTVTITPVGGCNPGNLAPANNGVFSLPGLANSGAVNATASTGLLNPLCNWDVAFVNAADSCTVRVEVDGDNDRANGQLKGLDNAIGTERTSVTAIRLNGRSVGPLTFDDPATDAIETNTVAELRFIVSPTSPGDCVGTMTPDVRISVPNTPAGTGTQAGVSAFANAEFTVSYTSETTGCLATGTDSFVVGRTLIGSGTTARASVTRKPNTSPARLIVQTRAQLRSSAASAPTCSYTFSLTPIEPPNTYLRGKIDSLVEVTTQSTEATDDDSTSTVFDLIMRGSSDFVDANPTDTNPAAKVYRISASYSKITVPIRVTSVFPADEVFTTEDKVDYTVVINSPCGGYLGLLPTDYGSQGDSASAQVFPGTILVYGSNLARITQGATAARSYSVDAYSDFRGQNPCSVTVIERNGPERCSPVGGDRQTVAYSSGTAALAFEFNHTCDAVAAAGGDATDGGSGPPAPPDIGLGDGDTDEATPVGPGDERFTG